MGAISQRTIEDIRRTVKCTDFLTKAGKGSRASNNGYICPACGSGTGNNSNKTGAVKYYPDTNRYHCHICQQGGDVIHLYQQQKSVDFLTAVKELADYARIEIEYDAEPRKTRRSLPDVPQRAQNSRYSDFALKEGKYMTTAENAPQERTEGKTEALQDFTEYYKACAARINDPAAVTYLNSRGISLETAAAYWIGFDPAADPANAPAAVGNEHKPHPTPRIIIPASKNFFVARRSDSEKNFKFANPKGCTPAIFNIKALYAPEVQEVYITESAFDALSIIEVGAQAIALNSAANADALIDALKEKPTAATLILSLDNDKRGNEAADTIRAGLQQLNICHISANISGDHKDANEALTADRGLFEESILFATEDAKRTRRKKEEAERAKEEERKKRTGALMIDNFLQAIQTEKYKPMPTGIRAIDNAIGGGFFRHQVILLGAAPGAGKTAMSQWIFETMASSGQDCLYLNLEMSKDQMLARSVARLTAKRGEPLKPTEILQGYKWTDHQRQAVINAATEYREKIAPHMIYNPETVTAELDSILQYIESEAERAQQPPIVIIDYLQLVRGREREDDTQVIKRAMAEFKNYAVKYNTIVFCVMAQNRAANKSGKITQEAGRDTSALEYGADLQLALVYTECLKSGKNPDELDDEERARLTLAVTKGRWAEGRPKAQLYFNGATMTFTEEDNRRGGTLPPERRHDII